MPSRPALEAKPTAPRGLNLIAGANRAFDRVDRLAYRSSASIPMQGSPACASFRSLTLRVTASKHAVASMYGSAREPSLDILKFGKTQKVLMPSVALMGASVATSRDKRSVPTVAFAGTYCQAIGLFT